MYPFSSERSWKFVGRWRGAEYSSFAETGTNVQLHIALQFYTQPFHFAVRVLRSTGSSTSQYKKVVRGTDEFFDCTYIQLCVG